jgi:hypothetical protein
MKHTPMYEMYAKIAPKVADWPCFVVAMGDLMRKPFDYPQLADDTCGVSAERR